MKNQAIEVNFTGMLYAGIVYTSLVVSGWLLWRLTIACFNFPSMANTRQMKDLDREMTRRVQESIMRDELAAAARGIIYNILSM